MSAQSFVDKALRDSAEYDASHAHLYGVGKSAACGYTPPGEVKPRTVQPKCEACLEWLNNFRWKEDQKKGSSP